MARDQDQFGAGETTQRLRAVLRGAFEGPPTPLKDIPKRSGESRAVRQKQPRRAKRASAKTARPAKKNRA